jgi:tRNA(adenine34) deaminase
LVFSEEDPVLAADPTWPPEAAESFMRLALEEARRARDIGEVPIGAVVVNRGGEVIGRGYNRTITDIDPTAHAEVIAVKQAAATLGNHRLTGCSLFVTIEPCLMCLGLLIQARIHGLWFGADDPQVGAVDGVFSQLEERGGFNHRFRVHRGLLADESREMLQDFFRRRRESADRGSD